MKRRSLLLSVIVALAGAFSLSSCVGQVERQFPWEEPGVRPVSGKDSSDRNLLILDFTATWCVNCPKMASAISELSDSVGVIPISVHYADAMSCDASDCLVEGFGISSFPTAVFSFDPNLTTSTASVEILSSLAERSLSGAPKGCDIKVRTSGGDGTCHVEASIDYLVSGTYSIGVAILEDGIVAPQVGSGEEHVHDNVLRSFLQENCSGDSLGTKQAGDSDNVKYSFTVQPQWNADELKAVVYIISEGPAPSVTNAAVSSL